MRAIYNRSHILSNKKEVDNNIIKTICYDMDKTIINLYGVEN